MKLSVSHQCFWGKNCNLIWRKNCNCAQSVLYQSAQNGCGASFPVDIRHLAGHGPRPWFLWIPFVKLASVSLVLLGIYMIILTDSLSPCYLFACDCLSSVMHWAYCKTVYFIQFYRKVWLNDLLKLKMFSVALIYWLIGLLFYLCAVMWLDGYR